MAIYHLLVFFLLVSCRGLDQNWLVNYPESIKCRWEDYMREAEKIYCLRQGYEPRKLDYCKRNQIEISSLNQGQRQIMRRTSNVKWKLCQNETTFFSMVASVYLFKRFLRLPRKRSIKSRVASFQEYMISQILAATNCPFPNIYDWAFLWK